MQVAKLHNLNKEVTSAPTCCNPALQACNLLAPMASNLVTSMATYGNWTNKKKLSIKGYDVAARKKMFGVACWIFVWTCAKACNLVSGLLVLPVQVIASAAKKWCQQLLGQKSSVQTIDCEFSHVQHWKKASRACVNIDGATTTIFPPTSDK